MLKQYVFLSLIFVVLTMSTSCKDDENDPNKAAYDNADQNIGGIMYDKFWSTEAFYDQASPHLAKLNAAPDFFRCKQCHAWDGLGTAGSYNNRGPKTTRPNVSSLNLYDVVKDKSYSELFDAMKLSTGRRDISYDLTTYDPATNATEGDKMPNLNQLLTDEQIWDMVKFMKEGMYDVEQLYDATYSGLYPTGSAAYTNLGKNGNAANGLTYYTANCALCHGTNGKLIPLETLSLGKFTRSKPNEVQHKIHYGQLGSTMIGEFDITLTQMQDLYKEISNTTTYPD
jgi:mono/diheme cytochrome c family protein